MGLASSSIPNSNSANGSIYLLKGYKGMDWSSSILFYEYISHGRVIFGQYEHEDIKSKLLPLLEPVDHVESLYHYKSRLSPEQTSTDGLFHHEFFVIKTTQWYYSLEKNETAIILQRGHKLEDVVLKIMNDSRDVDADDFEALTSIDRFLFQKIIQWIELSGQVKERYSLLESNCQMFAEKFKTEFCANYSGFTSFLGKVANYMFFSKSK